MQNPRPWNVPEVGVEEIAGRGGGQVAEEKAVRRPGRVKRAGWEGEGQEMGQLLLLTHGQRSCSKGK